MKNFFEIGGRRVGEGAPVYIIAEIGSNHDGELERAKELVRAAKSTGADAVKIQSFTAEGLLNPLRPNGNGGWVPHPAYPVIERLAVPEEWHEVLMEYAGEVGITFLSAPFEPARAELLDSIGVEAFKLASGELTNERLLGQVASYKRPVIISTGASYLEEVRAAVEVMNGEGNPEVALLHCTSLYPPRYEEVNLRAMTTLGAEFKCPVGLSDHTPGSTIPVAAVALGASIIEKHITLDRGSDGPDHPYAMEVGEFKEMVDEIRIIEKALGDGEKKPSEGEVPERVGARRAIYASVDIPKGATVAPGMLKVVRHAHGLDPSEYDRVIGRRALRDLEKDMPVLKGDI